SRHQPDDGFTELKGWAIYGRGSSGNRLFNVAKDEQIVSVARIEETEDTEAPEAEEAVKGEASEA
ncbi:MAG: hypothetical protein AAFR64_12760, partial [Pseudomonadota bacterium]